MTIILRAACVAALAPTHQAIAPQPNLKRHHVSAFANSATTLPIATSSRFTIHKKRIKECSAIQPIAAASPLTRFLRPSSRNGRRRSRAGFCPGMMVATDRAGTDTSDTSTVPVDSPAGSNLAAHGMGQDDWESLLRAGKLLSLNEGELLMSQGDSYDEPEDRELYLLISGRCRIEVLDKSVGMLKEGDFVGEASFTSGRPAPRTATVRAKKDGAKVVAWTWGGLRAFMADPANLRAKAALQACWMSGLAEKLGDVMSALGGQSVISKAEEDRTEAGDYGYRYLEDAREVESIVPVSAITLAWWTFAREYRALRRTFRFGEFKNTWISGPFSLIDRFLETSVFPILRPSRVDLPRDPDVAELQKRLGELKLSNKAIEERETARIAATKALLEDESRKGLMDAGNILRSQTPWFVMVPYKVLCWVLDVTFEDRPIQRFWFLETVARMPYFSYLSMLFFFETLGWWSGGAEVRKVHFAEEYNEMQHLRIMESLGGDTRWSDRFLARHGAIIYFWVITLGYMVSPFLAYNFSELIESHAVDTYTEFAEVNKELLKSLPPTPQALAYYQGGDMYLFDEFQTSRPAFSRRPTIRNLYDVFRCIRDDEVEHVKTMFACERGKGALTSPNAAAATPRWAEDAVGPATAPAANVGASPSSSASAPLPVGSSGSSNSDSENADEEASRKKKKKAVNGGEFDELRTDIARRSPLEVLSSAFDPLRHVLRVVEGGGDKGKGRKQARKKEGVVESRDERPLENNNQDENQD